MFSTMAYMVKNELFFWSAQPLHNNMFLPVLRLYASLRALLLSRNLGIPLQPGLVGQNSVSILRLQGAETIVNKPDWSGSCRLHAGTTNEKRGCSPRRITAYPFSKK